MKLERVLLVDDDESVRNEVIEKFSGHEVEVLPAADLEEMEHHLVFGNFQLIILDWLLDGDSSDLAQVCLRKIRNSFFVPVFVWTEEIETFNAEKDRVNEYFPEVCLRAASKSKVNYEGLLEFLQTWYKTTPAKLSTQFRKSFRASVEVALYTLAEHSEDDLSRGLKTLISLGDVNEVDMEHAADVLLRLVGRAIYADEEFSREVQEVVKQLEPPPDKKIESRIKELHMFYTPRDQLVRTGDIVKITFEREQDNCVTGVVITPACDLAIPKKTAFLRLALIRKANDNSVDKWSLDRENKLKVCFHEVLVLENKNLAAVDSKKRTSVMLYEHSYFMLDGAEVTLERNRRLDEPYRSDLLHSFVSHAGRIGMPEFTSSY